MQYPSLFFNHNKFFMSLELKAIEKKVGEETHIYQTDLRFEKNTINVL